LTNAFGVDISPDDNWVVGASVEVGDVESDGRVVEREAYTATVGYVTEPISGGAAIEWRDDDENGISRETWLFRSNLGVQVSPDWRALLKYNKAESNSGQGAFFAGEFTEAQVAGAYRPTENDRLNALVRYTYFEDLPGAQQISNSGQTGLPAQKSNIFSVDGQYRLNDWLTIGGKYGLRKGEVSLSRLDEDFLDSTATLGVIRADVHFIKKWDAVLEGRILEVEEAQDTRSGVLAALYRHVGDNAKVGIGYNFTDFSDDLTDLSYDDDGVFLNIIAKF
jgi:predicted porin